MTLFLYYSSPIIEIVNLRLSNVYYAQPLNKIVIFVETSISVMKMVSLYHVGNKIGTVFKSKVMLQFKWGYS